MSRANAAAIRRRVTNPQINVAPRPPPAPIPTSTPPPIEKPTGLTLQEFISALDNRVSKLEESLTKSLPNGTEPTVTDLLDEFQSRFEMIATEISDMKDTVLKLQTYTMDVNKMLIDERIQILSDVNPDSKTKAIGNDTDLNSVVSLGANTIHTEHTSVDMRELVQEEMTKKEENK